jgi:hypothetical protein
MNLLRSFLPARLVLITFLLLAPCLGLAAQNSGTTIDFPGGPLSKLTESLRADKDSTLTIINPEKLDPVLPAFSVRNQDTPGIIIALSHILRPQGYILEMTSPNLAVLIAADSIQSKDGFAAFQLGFQLSHQSIEQITAAIQTACEFAGGDAARLRFKFHPATKILFVAGPQLTIDRVVRQVIASLPDSPPAALVTDKK